MIKTQPSSGLEQRHNYNSITRYLHAHRFKHVLDYVDATAKNSGARPKSWISDAPGNVYFAIRERCDIEYVGVELNTDKAKAGNENFQNYPKAKIINQDAADPALLQSEKPDIITALESFEHIPPAAVAKIIETIATYKDLQLFLCSVPIEVEPSIWIKNTGSALMGYHRHKEYSWNETFWAGLYQLDKIPRHDLRHKGFDWRWLAQTIRLNMTMQTIHKSPMDWVPACLAPSIMFVAKPDKK